MTSRRFLPLILLAFLGASVWLSVRFPPVNGDEVFIAVHGDNLLSGHGQRYSLFDDVFAEPVAIFRDAFPQVALTTYNAWVGLWVKALPRAPWAMRLSSVMAAVLCLWLFARLGVGTGTGLWPMLLLVLDPVFWFGSSVTRPEVVLLLASGGVLLLMLELPKENTWSPVIIGAAAVLLGSVHPNGIAVSFGLLLSYGLLSGFSKRQTGSTLAGTAIGVLLWAVSVNWFKAWLSSKTFFGQLYQLPILTWPWSWRNALESLQHYVYAPTTFYFPTKQVAGWNAALALRAAAVLGGLAAAGYRCWKEKPPVWVRAVAWGLFGACLVKVALERKHETLYMLNLQCFIVLLAAYGYSGMRWAGRTGLALLAAGLICFLQMAVRLQSRYRSFSEVMQQYHTLVPERGLRVAAPNLFWFETPGNSYRDIGGVIFSYWYNRGKKEMRECLSSWKPDIVICDSIFDSVYFHEPSSAALLSREFRIPVMEVGQIDSGVETYRIFRLKWTP